MKCILASSSPRRKELLKSIINEFDIVSADIDERLIEDRIKDELSAYPMLDIAITSAKEISKAKAIFVYEKLIDKTDTLIIAADTLVCVSDEIMGKPKDRDDAVRMLRKLSKEVQYVLTGVCLIYNGKIDSFVETSMVYFNKLDEKQERKIQKYCDTAEPYDKAGAYGIQVIGDDMVDHIEGDINNIIGFPVDKVREKISDYL